MKKKYAYTGQTNLEVMQDAKNYNKYLFNLVKKEIVKVKKDEVRVLDFGAGIGTYADIFKQQGVSVDCIEIDPNGVKVLKDKGYQVYSSISEINEKYDIVYSFNVLEHVEDDTRLLLDMKKGITDSGSIVIFVPAFKVIFSKLDVLVEHLRRYRKADMVTLAKECRLTLSVNRYCDPVGFILALLYRFSNGSGNLNPKTIWIFDRMLFPISIVLETITHRLFGKNVLAVYKKAGTKLND